MANEEHLAILKQGVKVWNQWRMANRDVIPNLVQANLHAANLQGVNLHKANLHKANLQLANLQLANLSGADLSHADLQGVDVRRADLQRADLGRASLAGAHLAGASLLKAVCQEADLRGADFRGASLLRTDLRRANFGGASLEGASFGGANLEGADLAHAYAAYTTFGNLDLRHVHGLATLRHIGPSTIGIDTLYRSHGQIPEGFLRGCGVPDSMIAYASSLVAAERPIDYYSVFISYASADQACAERVHEALQNKGVRCWFAPHDLEIGAPIVRGIDEAIRMYDKLLIILSEASVNSRWVEFEVSTALHRELEQGRTMLFPIRIDDTVLHTPSSWAAPLRARHIGDFRGWKDHDAYQEAFARLLRDLKAKE